MKRLMAMLLALVMVLSMIPMTAIPAFAEEYLIFDEAPAEEPAAPVEEPVEEPTEAPVEEPVEEPTEAPVEEPVEEPTEEPAEEPTEEPVEEPTEEPTEEPAEEPTEEPVEEPTEAPAEEPVEEPTEAPVEGPPKKNAEPAGYYGVDFSEIAPPIREMTAMALGAEFTAAIEAGDYAWFVFTPAVSGTYAFSSGSIDGYYMDAYGYLLDANMEILYENDDGAGYPNFSMTYDLEAGQTYILVADALGEDAGYYTVQVTTAKKITDISVEPMSIPEGAWCWYDRLEDADGTVAYYPNYYWNDIMEVTLTFSDGSTATGTGASIEHEGVSYQLVTGDKQWLDESWEVGNTYDVTVSTADETVMTETTVKITSSKIRSISVEDVVIPEYSCGEWRYDYDEETDEEVEYFWYDWVEGLNWTVTLKNGDKISGSGYGFDYDGYYYPITSYDDQWSGNPWVAGETYTGSVCIAEIGKDVEVTIGSATEGLAQVQNLRVTDVGTTSLKIKFDAVEDADRYEIYVDGEYWGNTTKTSYTISDLTLGCGYGISVAAAQKVDGVWISGIRSEWVWASTYRDISDYYVKLEYTSTVYDGTQKRPEVTLKTSSSGKTINAENYQVSYGDNLNVGQGVVHVAGNHYTVDGGEYGGMIYKSFKILPQQVNWVEVTDSRPDSLTIHFDSVEGATEYWIYSNGNRVAKVDGTTYTFTNLTAGKTYKITVRANAVVDEVQLDDWDPFGDEAPEIKQKDYTGKASGEVIVRPAYPLSESNYFMMKYATRAYTGKARTNSFTIKCHGKTLKEGTDYTVSYENNKNIGTATATITGKGKYTGTLAATFDIVPAQMTKPKVKVEQLKYGTALYITYKNAKNADWFNIYLNGELYVSTGELGHFTEYLEPGTYRVAVAAVSYIDGKEYVGALSDSVKVTVRHSMENCSVQVLEDYFVYTGKSHKPEVAVYGYNGETLTEGVDYTLSYKNNKNTGRGCVEVKGKGNYSGSIKGYFSIIPAMVTGLKISSTTKNSVKISFKKSSSNSAKYYNVYVDGEYDGRTTGSSYTIKNLEPGETYYVHVEAEKTVGGTTYCSMPSQTIEVWPGTYIGGYKVTLEYTKAVFKGEPLLPEVVIKTSSKKSAKTLVENEDYYVYYIDCDVPGKATVCIEGAGEYAGVINKTYTIVPDKVENVWASYVSDKQMEVSFDPVLGATEYWVYVNGSRKAKTADTSCVISGLKKDKTYKITVKAVATVDGTNYTGATSDTLKFKLEPPKGPKIAFVSKIVGQAWWDYVGTGVEEWAEETGYDVIYTGPRTVDGAAQVRILENLVAQGVDILCVAPNDPNACEAVLKKAREKGIVVITCEAATMSNIDYNIEPFDDAGMGRFLMDQLAKTMGGKGKYVTMVGSMTMESHNNWADAAVARQQEAYPNMTLVSEARVSCDSDTATAQTLMENLISKYGEIGVISTSTFGVCGPGNAIEATGTEGESFVVSLGMPSEARGYLKSGALQSVVLWDPAMTAKAMLNLGIAAHLGVDIASGINLEVPGYESVEVNGTCVVGNACIAITEDNVDKFTF